MALNYKSNFWVKPIKEKEIEKYLGMVGSCPVCGAPIKIKAYTNDLRLIGSCKDAFTVGKFMACPACGSENIEPTGIGVELATRKSFHCKDCATYFNK